MTLYGQYLSIIADSPDGQESEVYLNIENLYLDTLKGGTNWTSGVQLKCGGDFHLEALCNDHNTAETWMQHLSVFCVKTNLLENYKLSKNLDKGGFAVVYLGEHLTTGKKFAIKMVDKSKIKSKRNYVRVCGLTRSTWSMKSIL